MLLPVNGYYKSINEILNHILEVDISWLNDLKGYFPQSPLTNNLIIDIPEGEFSRLFLSKTPFIEARNKIDNIIIDLCNYFSSMDYYKEIGFIGMHNTKNKKLVWEILFHIFNHQTHHRGQISQILDENKITNDFSNIIRIE